MEVADYHCESNHRYSLFLFSSLRTITEEMQNPWGSANIFSRCTFAWFIPTVLKGYNKELTEDDLFRTLDSQKSSHLGDLLEDAWEKEKKAKLKPSLWRVIWRVFRFNFLVYALIAALTELIFKTGQCLSFIILLKYYSQETQTLTKVDAYICAITLTLFSFAIVVGQHQCMYNYRILGMKVRVACCSLIYRKSLRINKTAMDRTSIGHVINLITNDVNRFDYIAPLINNLWLCPIQILIVIFILHYITGWTGIIGVIIFILIIPIQIFIGRKLSVLRGQTAEITDQRLRIMNEIISGIQIIKMFAWEKPLTSLIRRTRCSEIKKLRCTSMFLASLMVLMNCLPKLGLFASILAYACMGFVVTPTHMFGLVAFYNMLKLPLNKFFPQALFRWGEAVVSVKRIEEFLKIDEAQWAGTLPKNIMEKESHFVGIKLKGVSSKWDENSKTATLNNLTLNIRKPKLVAVVGSVGSGKSSLLNVFLKELPLINGQIDIKGIVSYSSQDPWLFRGTIKENILFHQPYNEKRYKTVIRICALEKDLLMLPESDNTIVVENGLNLSGGQKVRINLARAVYKIADIYLLDDSLSSVDNNVAEFIFDECISKFLKDKCVILVSNQSRFLNYVDYIYVLHEGKLIVRGTYKNLQESGLELLDFLKNTDDEKCNSTQNTCYDYNVNGNRTDNEVKESRDIGTVDFKVYKKYLIAGGKIYVHIFLLLLAVLFVASCAMFDAGMGFWSNIDEKLINITLTDTFFTRQEYIIIFSSIMLIIIVTAVISATAYYLLFIKCSENLHNNVFDKVIAAPMNFFYLNPSGRILNRFSKDLGLVDDNLHTIIVDTVMMTLAIIAVLIVKTVINYWLCIVILFLIILFYGTRKLYLPAIVAIKRLEGVTKSPVYTHVKTSLEGLVTIRAFRKESHRQQIFDELQDIHSSSWFMYLSSVFTYRFLIDILGIVLVGIVTFSFFLIGDSYAGTAGLAVTQSMMFMSMVQWCIRQSCEVTVTMTSVERITEYLNLSNENNNTERQTIIRETWPEHGNIEFNNVTMRYNPLKNPVLKNLNFEVKSTQKVGIVGRTGAGKSSLCSALFRLTDVDGCITVDGENIKNIPLQNLRSKISIIPQKPVLFSDTIRKNLDPFEQFNDGEIWNVLNEVELKKFVADMPEGLSTKITASGTNLSVGQRQLFCLARAIIRKNKILIMDEATANVDPKTDALIQLTIRKKFSDCTVLTIAHRLHTIMNSDVILVIEDGEIKEYGHPYTLLKNKRIFFEMISRPSQVMLKTIQEMAENAYNVTKKDLV